MAKKKKENTLSYLQMPLPEGGKYSKMTKLSFSGLNKRQTHDSGMAVVAENVSTKEYPYLTPAEKEECVYSYQYGASYNRKPICMFGFDDFLVVAYRDSRIGGGSVRVMVDYITADGDIHTGILETNVGTSVVPKSIVQFNVYDTPTDPLTGQYVKKLLFFPNKVSMYMNIVEAESDPETWENEENELILKSADLGVMYCYTYTFDNGSKQKYYYTVEVEKKTDADGNVTYERYVKDKSRDKNGERTPNYFFCDGMEVLVKEFTPSGEVETPPDTASHNYYYRNSKTSNVYRWVDDASNSENSGWKISIPPAVPSLNYATVHLSRVFGVDDDRVYASGFNDYANWNLDTVDEYNESNSWCSPSQSNTKAGGKFTGITTFQNHVICFKQDFMHEIYNTKNPFRLQDIYAEGTIDNRTIQDVDGKLIFVSSDGVKIYTGSNPRIIDYNLNMSKYTYAVSGTDNRNYYLYCEDGNGNSYFYVYDTYTEQWTDRSPTHEKIISFAHNKNGMYLLDQYGSVYKMDSGSYNSQVLIYETDLITNKTVDIKHIKKIQMLVDIPETVNGCPQDVTALAAAILYDDEERADLSLDELEKRMIVNKLNEYGKYTIRVKPRKTANYGFKLSIAGMGYIKLYGLEIFVEAGGDLYV